MTGWLKQLRRIWEKKFRFDRQNAANLSFVRGFAKICKKKNDFGIAVNVNNE